MQKDIKINGKSLSLIPGQIQVGEKGRPFYLCCTEILKSGNLHYTFRFENTCEFFTIETDKMLNFVRVIKQK
jgi:hypothetical protein